MGGQGAAHVRPILVLAVATAFIAVVVTALGLDTGVHEVGERVEMLLAVGAGAATVVALYLAALDLIAGDLSFRFAPPAVAISVLVLVALGLAALGGPAVVLVALTVLTVVVAVGLLPIAGGQAFLERERRRGFRDPPPYVSLLALVWALAAMGGAVAVVAVASPAAVPERFGNPPVGDVLDSAERRDLRDLALQLQKVEGDEGRGLSSSIVTALDAGGSVAEMIGLVADVRGAGEAVARDMLGLLVTATARRAWTGTAGAGRPAFAPTFRFDGGNISIGGVELTLEGQPRSQAGCRERCCRICRDREMQGHGPRDVDESSSGGLPQTR